MLRGGSIEGRLFDAGLLVLLASVRFDLFAGAMVHVFSSQGTARSSGVKNVTRHTREHLRNLGSNCVGTGFPHCQLDRPGLSHHLSLRLLRLPFPTHNTGTITTKRILPCSLCLSFA